MTLSHDLGVRTGVRISLGTETRQIIRRDIGNIEVLSNTKYVFFISQTKMQHRRATGVFAAERVSEKI